MTELGILSKLSSKTPFSSQL
jgi:hypothetical protein